MSVIRTIAFFQAHQAIGVAEKELMGGQEIIKYALLGPAIVVDLFEHGRLKKCPQIALKSHHKIVKNRAKIVNERENLSP